MFKKHTNSLPPEESGVWLKKVKPRLEEIENLRARGATMQQISEVLVVGGGVLSKLKSKHPELAKALSIASDAREEHLVGRMWELADGRATRFEKTEIKDENGNIKGSQEKTIKLEPQLSAQHAILKRFHGWSDNPKVDDAVAKALNNKDWTAKLSLLPGFSDLSPKSSEADNFSAEPRNCQPTSCPSQSDGSSEWRGVAIARYSPQAVPSLPRCARREKEWGTAPHPDAEEQKHPSAEADNGDGGGDATDPNPAPDGQALPRVRGDEAPSDGVAGEKSERNDDDSGE